MYWSRNSCTDRTAHEEATTAKQRERWVLRASVCRARLEVRQAAFYSSSSKKDDIMDARAAHADAPFSLFWFFIAVVAWLCRRSSAGRPPLPPPAISPAVSALRGGVGGTRGPVVLFCVCLPSTTTTPKLPWQSARAVAQICTHAVLHIRTIAPTASAALPFFPALSGHDVVAALISHCACHLPSLLQRLFALVPSCLVTLHTVMLFVLFPPSLLYPPPCSSPTTTVISSLVAVQQTP